MGSRPTVRSLPASSQQWSEGRRIQCRSGPGPNHIRIPGFTEFAQTRARPGTGYTMDEAIAESKVYPDLRYTPTPSVPRSREFPETEQTWIPLPGGRVHPDPAYTRTPGIPQSRLYPGPGKVLDIRPRVYLGHNLRVERTALPSVEPQLRLCGSFER